MLPFTLNSCFSTRRAALPIGLATCLLSLVSPAAHAQTPAWQMAVAAGGGAYSEIDAMTTDASGNVYLAGWYSSPTFTLGSTTLTNPVADGFSTDAFVAKWSPASNSFVWAKRAGGTGYDRAKAIALSGTSIYLTGECAKAASFDGLSLSDGPSFVAKLTDAGSTASFDWVQRADGTLLALAATGNAVYAAGYFTGTASFGGTSLASVGATDVVVAKLTDAGSTGAFAWAQRAGGDNSEYLTGLSASGTSVYLAGQYSSAQVAFGGTTLARTSSANANSFVAKLTDAGGTGSFAWALSSAGETAANAVASAPGAVYVAGSFQGVAGFGATTLDGGTGGSVFVTKLTDAGSTAAFTWTQQAGGSSLDDARGLVVVGSSVYMSGRLARAGSFGTFTVPAATDRNLYVTRLTDAGKAATFDWVQTGSSGDYGQALCVAVAGPRVYLGGRASAPAVFGSFSLSLPGGPAAFLAALNTQVLATAPAVSLAELTLAPNPAHGTTTVQVPPGVGAAPTALVLHDALGRVARRYAASAGPSYALDLAGLAPGVYALRIEAAGAPATRRLVVE